jgi:uncharacterized membrane protein YagU involved in acid resistance
MMRKMLAILLGGAAAGALDHMSALASLVPNGATATHIQQYVASGVVGPAAAFSGGWVTSALGVGVHFSLTTLMAGIFVIMAGRFPVLLRQPWLSGPAYGVLIYFVMTYVAVPLSAAPGWKPAHGWAMVGGLMAHCFYVGLPVAFIARAFLTRLAAVAPPVAQQAQA